MIDIPTTITTAAQTYTPPSGSIVLPSKTYFGQRGEYEPVPLVQYDDTLPIIAAALYLNGQPYTVPDGAAVNIRMAKGDGTYVYNPALGVSEDRQTAYIAVTYQMTVIAGNYCPILELVVSGDVAGTSELPLQIAENPVPEDAIASTDEYKTIQQLAAEVNQAAQIVTDNLPGIQYIQQNADTITAVAQNSENIAAVGGSIGNVNSVAQNLTPIQTAAANIPAIQAAPTAASDAAASATLAESWAVGGTGTREGEDTNNAQYWAQQAQKVAQGAQGWYETEESLQAAHPTGENGQWAIVGSTDTIWTWDSDTSAWVDSGAQVDLSNYYTKEQSDERFATAAQGKKANTAVQSVNGVSASAGKVTIPVGAQIELLWTNPSFESGSTFAPQTVSVDLSGYAFVMIEFLPFGQQWYDWTGKAMRLYPVGSTGNLEFMLLNQVGGQTGAIIECVSRLFYTSSSGVTFQNNVYTGDGGHTNLRNDWGVPTKIYGIKL